MGATRWRVVLAIIIGRRQRADIGPRASTSSWWPRRGLRCCTSSRPTPGVTHGYDFPEEQVPLPSYTCSSLEQRNFNASDRGATGLASEPKGRNPVQTRLPATSGRHRDRLGVYPRSAPVAPIGSILQPLPDNRQELTWCPPLIADAIRPSATGDQGSLSYSLPVIRYDNSIINAVSVKNLEK